MSADRKLIVRSDYQGYGRVELGGVDLSPYTQRIEIETTAGGGTFITIQLANDVALDLEAEAVLAIKSEPGVAGADVMTGPHRKRRRQGDAGPGGAT